MANPQDKLQGWKQRYDDAKGELEEREKQWGDIEQALPQGLNRLSLVANDSAPERSEDVGLVKAMWRNNLPAEEMDKAIYEAKNSGRNRCRKT